MFWTTKKKYSTNEKRNSTPEIKASTPKKELTYGDTNPKKPVTHETYEGTMLVRFSRLTIFENFKTHYVFWIIIDKYTYLVLRNFHAGA